MKRILPPDYSRNATVAIRRVRHCRTHRPKVKQTQRGHRVPGPSNRSTTEEVIMRRAEVLKMRSRGIRTTEIAEKFNVNPKTIWRDLKMVLKDEAKYAVKHLHVLRHLEIGRLDDATNAIYDKVLAGSFGAIDALIKLGRRRSLFLGLDAEQAGATTSQPLPWSDTDEPLPWGMTMGTPTSDADDDEEESDED